MIRHTQTHCPRARLLALTLAGLLVLLAAGCKHFSNEPTAVALALQGSYVGQANLNGSSQPAINMSLSITGPDSLGKYAGSIGYSSVVTALDSISRDSTGDTLRFSYTRSPTLYRLWALVNSAGLEVHYTAPTGIAVFRLNREIGGFNMSGTWNGLLYSNFLQQSRNTAMAMDQEGSSFYGTLTVTLLESAQFNFRSGAYNGSAFQLGGTVHYAGTDYPLSWGGNYVTHDSITGTWQAGTNGEIDGGTFYLGRRFQ